MAASFTLFLAAALGFITYEALRLWTYVDDIREGRCKFTVTYAVFLVIWAVLFGVMISIYMYSINASSWIAAYFSGISFPSTVVVLTGAKAIKKFQVDDLVVSAKTEIGTERKEEQRVEARLAIEMGRFDHFFQLGSRHRAKNN